MKWKKQNIYWALFFKGTVKEKWKGVYAET